MRIQRLTTTKRISPEGRLSLETPEVQEFCRQHPNRSVIVRVELLPIPPSQKSISYYWKVVVPTVQRGLYDVSGYDLTLSQTDRFIRENIPVTIDERWEDGKIRKRIREIDELDAAEFNELIEQLKVYASEHLFVYIEEPEYL